VTVARTGIVALCVVRPVVCCVIVRGGNAGIMVTQRHAETRRRGRCPLDGDGECQRGSNQDAGES
jgi:hypothetical protein